MKKILFVFVSLFFVFICFNVDTFASDGDVLFVDANGVPAIFQGDRFDEIYSCDFEQLLNVENILSWADFLF